MKLRRPFAEASPYKPQVRTTNALRSQRVDEEFAGEFRGSVNRERMRCVVLRVRCGRLAVKNVVGADRNEDGTGIARETRSIANGEGVDLEGRPRFRFAPIHIVKRRRVYEDVRTTSLDCSRELLRGLPV